jgi:hypothetical protein
MAIKDENDSYLKKGMKDETEPLKKNVYGSKKPMPTSKKPINRKKAALSSMLGSLSSGATFKN